MDLRRFQIGDVVRVLATVKAEYDEHRGEPSNRVLVRKALNDQPRPGRVVGLTRIYLGKYTAESFFGQAPGCDPDWAPPSLSVEKVVTVWLVRFGMLNKPVCVADEDALQHDEPVTLPMLYRRPLPVSWRKELVSEMRGIMKDWPRDAKGRWMKATAREAGGKGTG